LSAFWEISDKRNGAELGEKSALNAALTYFRNAAPKHTSDEEESLFPRLRASEAAIECLERLESDHQTASWDHDSFRWRLQCCRRKSTQQLAGKWRTAGEFENDPRSFAFICGQ
jgi:hypothetical protein